MGLKLMKKKASLSLPAGRARGKTVPTPVPSSPALDEGPRVKTSILIMESLMRQAQERSRLMGISYNAFINVAIFEKLNASANAYARSAFEAQITPLLKRQPRPPSRSASAPLAGYGFTLPSETGESDYASWPDVARYAAMQLKHPTETFEKIAKRLGMSLSVARAADIAQESPEFDLYLQRKNKGKEMV